MNGRFAALELFRSCTVGRLIEALQQAPTDAKIDDIFKDPWTKNIIMVFTHDSFGVVPEGDCVPQLKLTASTGAFSVRDWIVE